MAVEVLQVDGFRAGFESHAQAVAGVLLGAAQLAAVGVGADIFFDQLLLAAKPPVARIVARARSSIDSPSRLPISPPIHCFRRSD